MEMVDYGRSAVPHQSHRQPSCQNAGMDGGENLLLPEEGSVLPSWDQGVQRPQQ